MYGAYIDELGFPPPYLQRVTVEAVMLRKIHVSWLFRHHSDMFQSSFVRSGQERRNLYAQPMRSLVRKSLRPNRDRPVWLYISCFHLVPLVYLALAAFSASAVADRRSASMRSSCSAVNSRPRRWRTGGCSRCRRRATGRGDAATLSKCSSRHPSITKPFRCSTRRNG